MKRKGFTLIELLVVIAIIAMLLAILMPALSKVKKIAQRVVCGTNLKGLGTAQTVYANDYEDRYTVQVWNRGRTQGPGTGGWQTQLFDPTAGNLTIGASLYLLVREADVSPKSFVCPSSAQFVFDGKNDSNFDVTELWDFGHTNVGSGPARCQSYAYHMPYSKYAADGSRGASFAIMGDRNPYHDDKLTYAGATTYCPSPQSLGDNSYDLYPDWPTGTTTPTPAQKHQIQGANSQPHGREGQNVVFGDGHNSFEKRPDVAVNHDNIYSSWPVGVTAPGPAQLRRGVAPVNTWPNSEPQGTNDSLLLNDSRRP